MEIDAAKPLYCLFEAFPAQLASIRELCIDRHIWRRQLTSEFLAEEARAWTFSKSDFRLSLHICTTSPTMATETALPDILGTFQNATTTAIQGLPTSESLLPPENGITLFDVKNEIFLSYLQALALRNLNVIRSIKDGSDSEAAEKLSNEITKQLVEHRVYLERGVRPLEQKLKYQADRVVKAADDADRAVEQTAKVTARTKAQAKGDEDSSEESDSEDDSEGDADAGTALDSNNYKPRLASMTTQKPSDVVSAAREKSKADGVYRPPRISATTMPTTDRREKAERKSGRSATLEEYVSTELSHAPLAQPSIGSNLASGGRSTKNARQLKEEAERRDYEETHLMRLPAMSRKEKAKKGLGRAQDGGFGGEAWQDLSTGLDRIGDLTKRKSKESMLDRSRKRPRAVEDGPRGNGHGEAFDMTKRRLQKKMKRN